MARNRDLEDTANEAMETTDRAYSKAKQGTRRAAKSADDMMDDAGDNATSTLEDVAETGGRMLRKGYARAEETLGEAGAMMEDKVREKPLLALAGAVAFGVLLAGMMGRR